MAGQIGDTVVEVFRSLIRDPNTATPVVSSQDLERLQAELNRLQGVTNQQVPPFAVRLAALFKC